MTGYEQSIQNLAWKVNEFTKRDFETLNPDEQLAMEDNADKLLEFLENNPELKVDWDNLEEIASVVCETYDVEYDTVMSDVWTEMIRQDLRDPKYWN